MGWARRGASPNRGGEEVLPTGSQRNVTQAVSQVLMSCRNCSREDEADDLGRGASACRHRSWKEHGRQETAPDAAHVGCWGDLWGPSREGLQAVGSY